MFTFVNLAEFEKMITPSSSPLACLQETVKAETGTLREYLAERGISH